MNTDHGNAAAHSNSRLDRYLLTLLAISTIANVVLSLAVVKALNRTPPAVPSAPRLADIGAQLPPIVGNGPTGTATTISFDEREGRPTLLYVFTPTCKWCVANADNAKALFAAASGSHRIVALSLSAGVTLGMEQLPGFVHVLTEPTGATIDALKLGPTPTTMLVSPSGRVLKVWPGAYSGSTARQIERHFDITLPGLTQQDPR